MQLTAKKLENFLWNFLNVLLFPNFVFINLSPRNCHQSWGKSMVAFPFHFSLAIYHFIAHILWWPNGNKYENSQKN